MFVDNVIIVSLIVGCLAFFLFVAIFIAVFQRELGTKHCEKLEEGDVLEKQRLTPMPDDAQLAFTTETIQPESKTSSAAGYPHVQEEDSEEFMTDPDVTPTLSILLRYDRQRNYLLVKLLSIFDLPTRNDKTEVSSFLEVRLLPNFGQNPIQTDVYFNTSSPKLDETFEFEVNREELAQQKIEIVVMDAREYSNRYIGSAMCKIGDLNQNDLMTEKEVHTAMNIGKTRMQKSVSASSMSSLVDSGDEMPSIYDGSSSAESEKTRKTKATVRLAKDWEYVAGMEPMMLVSLHYDKIKQNLVLAIIKVANLKALPNDKIPDPYVKVHIMIRNKIKLKKKTAVMKQELNPVYNQKLEFPISAKDLENVKLVLAVKNHVPTRSGSLRGRPASLHEVAFGEQSTGSFLEHWKTVISTNKPIAKWHILTKS